MRHSHSPHARTLRPGTVGSLPNERGLSLKVHAPLRAECSGPRGRLTIRALALLTVQLGVRLGSSLGSSSTWLLGPLLLLLEQPAEESQHLRVYVAEIRHARGTRRLRWRLRWRRGAFK